MRRSLVLLIGATLIAGVPSAASASENAPSVTTAIGAGNQLTVRWGDTSAGTLAYDVQSSCDGGVTWIDEPTLDVNSHEWTFTTTSNASACLVRVGAVQPGGNVVFSDIAQPSNIGVRPPTTITVTTDGDTSRISWNASSDAAKFIVYASHDEGSTWVQVASADANASSVTLHGLDVGTPIRVAAVDKAGTIALSDTQRGLTAAAASAVQDLDDEHLSSLTSRSTIQIALTSLLALAAMFMLGMFIGRRSRRDDFTDFPADDLTGSRSEV